MRERERETVAYFNGMKTKQGSKLQYNVTEGKQKSEEKWIFCDIF